MGGGRASSSSIACSEGAEHGRRHHEIIFGVDTSRRTGTRSLVEAISMTIAIAPPAVSVG